MRYTSGLIILSTLLVLVMAPPGLTFDHGHWSSLLNRHVYPIHDHHATQVDYAGFAHDRKVLGEYLESLAGVPRDQFDSWSLDEQLAFLINAYNAWTIELVLTRYPDLSSIKDLGSFFQSPWKIRFIPLLEEERTLDDIEHKLIRGSGRYKDPRIHFAVNCASIGCPALRPEAFEGESIDRQLDTATNLFLSDRTRNRLEQNRLKVSSIFRWYRGDFEEGWRGAGSLHEFFVLFADELDLSPSQVKKLKEKKLSIEFLQYNWSLNDKKK